MSTEAEKQGAIVHPAEIAQEAAMERKRIKNPHPPAEGEPAQPRVKATDEDKPKAAKKATAKKAATSNK